MLIAVLVAAIIIVGKTFRDNMLNLISTNASNLQNKFFSPAKIHKFPFSMR